MISIDEIKSFFKGEILINEPLNKYTSIGIGGPADLFLVPIDKEDSVNLSVYLQKKDIQFVVIGNGSNILVNDEGVRSVVVNFERGLNQIKSNNGYIRAEAGVKLGRFVDYCINNRRQGAEKLAGIPGTIGGAIIMNASAWGSAISDYIVEIEVVRNGTVVNVKKEDAKFSYRSSGLINDVILSAAFDLPLGIIEDMVKMRFEYLQKRNQTQPLNYPNSGSIFKNPQGIIAAKLIEDCDLKGIQIGNAQISEKHANFIINLDDAKASDVLQLINIVRKKVFEKFNVKLEPEIKFIGFTGNVLNDL